MEIEGYRQRVYIIHSSTSSHHTAHTSYTHTSHVYHRKVPSTQMLRISNHTNYRVSSPAISSWIPTKYTPKSIIFLPSTCKSFLIIPRLGALYNSYPLLLHLQLGSPSGQLGSPSVKQEREAPRQISILSMHITTLIERLSSKTIQHLFD